MTDFRIQFNERMVGNGHPTLPDTLNRHLNVEHNPDGSHKKITSIIDPYVDVRAYGAIGDGITDDTTALQNTLNSGIAEIFLPPFGIFLFTTLIIPSTVKYIRGGGTLKLKNNAISGTNIETVLSANNYQGLLIDNINVDLNKSNQTIKPRLLFTDITDLRINNSKFINGYTVRTERCIDFWFTNNRSEGHDYYGLVCYGGKGLHIKDNELNNNDFSGYAVVGGGSVSRGGTWVAFTEPLNFSATSGNNVTVTSTSNIFESTDVGSHIYSSGLDGKALIVSYLSPSQVLVNIDNILSTTFTSTFTIVKYAKDINIIGNKCNGNVQFGINIDQYNEGVKVIGNSCNETSQGDGIIVQSRTFKSVIANNTCYRNFRDGIRINGDSLGSSSTVVGNNCCLNGTSGPFLGSGIYINSALDCVVADNICNDNWEAGIRYSNVNRGTCSGNVCLNRDTLNQNYGIYQPTGGNIIFFGNYCFNNGIDFSILKTSGAQNVWIGNREDDTTLLGQIGIGDIYLYREGTGSWRTPNSFKIDSNLSIYGNLETFKRKIQDKVNSYILLDTDSGSIISNEGAAGIITCTLPATSASNGFEYTFIRNNAGNVFRIAPTATEIIRNGATSGGAGKYFSLDTNGGSARLICSSSGAWEVVHSNGTTSFQA